MSTDDDALNEDLSPLAPGSPLANAPRVSPRSVNVPRSELVCVLESLPDSQRQLLGVEPLVVLILDIAVGVARCCMDAEDLRPRGERFDWLPDALARVDPENGAAAIVEWLNTLDQEAAIARIKRLKSDRWQLFLRRLVGAAVYDRLFAAFRSDAKVVMAAIDWAADQIKPFALALDDCSAVTGGMLVRDTIGLDTDSALQLVLELHAKVTKFRAEKLGDLKALERSRVDVIGDMATLLEELRDATSGPTRAALAQLSTGLSRKLEGARFALEQSVDGASQAASSLVELLDRMLRTAFPPEEVLLWLDATRRSGSAYVHFKGSTRWPTKRAEALCFVYGGRDVVTSQGNALLLDAFAEVVVQARSQLQKVKHADTGSPTESAKVREMLHCIEAFLTLVVRLGWTAMEASRVEQIRARLAA